MKNTKQYKATLLLLVTAIIWGLAFVAQEVGAEYLGTFFFNGIRFLLGAVSLLPVIFFFEREPLTRPAFKKLTLVSLAAGTVLFLASTFQQYGVQLGAPAGKAGFITGLYTVLVPVLSFLLLRKRTNLFIWLGALLAVGGLLLLNLDENFNLSVGPAEWCLLTGSLMWAVHILVVDRFAGEISPLKFSLGQFVVCGAESLVCALFFEQITAEGIRMALIPLLYGGLMSVGVAYTCQVMGQKDSDPTVAAIIFSMESVFSVIGGVLILHTHMTLQGYLGCGLILAGILLAQFSPDRNKQPAAAQNEMAAIET